MDQLATASPSQHSTGLLVQHERFKHEHKPQEGKDYAWEVMDDGHSHLDIQNFSACFGNPAFIPVLTDLDYIQYMESMCLDLLYIITQRINTGRLRAEDLQRIRITCSDPLVLPRYFEDLNTITRVVHLPTQAH